MVKRIFQWLFPITSLAAPPAIRLILGSTPRPTYRRLMAYIIAGAGYVGAALIIGRYGFLANSGFESRTAEFRFILLFAVLFGQFLVSMSAFGLSMSFIHTKRADNTWDIIRVTAGGTRQTIRAAWAAITFYRLGGWLSILVYAPRLFMFGVLCIDLMGYRGEYLSYIVGGANPDIPLWLGFPLIALLLAMTFILPLTGLGVEVAMGLLSSTAFRSRFFTGLLQLILTVARAIYGLLAGLIMTTVGMPTDYTQPHGAEWITSSLAAATGDWGFSLIGAPNLELMWRTYPNFAWFGVSLLVIMLLQLLITEGLLRWAARRAQRQAE